MKLAIRFSYLITLVGATSIIFACGGGSSGGGNGGAANLAGNNGGTNASGGAGNGSSGTTNSSGGTNSSNGGAGACDPMADPTGSGDTTCPAYLECVESMCADEQEQCYGADYLNGDFSGGDCEAFMDCSVACDCDSDCSTACFNNAGSVCTTCLTSTLTGCVLNNCFSILTSCTSGGGGAGNGGAGNGGAGGIPNLGSATCADLQACCASLTGTDKTDCDTLYGQVMAGGDIACSASYQIYQLAGQCQ